MDTTLNEEILALRQSHKVRLLRKLSALSVECQRLSCNPNDIFRRHFDTTKKIYSGLRENGNHYVYKDGILLDLRHDVMAVSEKFGWSHNTPWTTQLSIAISADLLEIGEEKEIIGEDGILDRMISLFTKISCDQWEISGMNILRIISKVATFEDELPQYG